MSKFEIPEDFLEKYSSLSQEELLAKFYESEQSHVEKNRKTKEIEEISKKEKEELSARIEKLESDFGSRKKEDFLRDKKMTDDEKKDFEEKIGKGYTFEDAFELSTKESREVQRNQEEFNNANELSGKFSSADVKSIPAKHYNQLAEEGLKDINKLKEFKEVDERVKKGELEVV